VQNAGGTLHADGVTLFSGVRLEVGRGAQLSIGKGTFLNRNTTVVCEREVTIGRDCMISWDVVILDTDQHERPGIGKGTAPVRIGDGAWICCRSVILKGVTIGDGAVIGAGAIVTRDVPAHTLALGQPARLVRRLDTGETIHETNGHQPTFDNAHGWPASVVERKS
ncbi:MAG TPA: acyltransferase, partial [Dehalococcoidia bacterium]|nr:acyltransferase [Dehalococcoidia bacterium]